MEQYLPDEATEIYHYDGQLKFTVNEDTMNTHAPLVRQHIERINNSRTIKHATNNVMILIHVLNKLRAFDDFNCQYRPDFEKKTCQIRIYPVQKKFSLGVWPFQQHGLGLYKNNTIKFDAKFFNVFKNYESIILGRRYNFNNHGDKHFALLRYELAEKNWMNFKASHQEKSIVRGVRESAIKTGFEYCWYDRTREDAACYYTFGARMINRNTSHQAYPTPSDVISSQLYRIFAKIQKTDYFTHFQKLTFGIDPVRDEWFGKFKMHLRKFHRIGQAEIFVHSYFLGVLYGNNVLPNDKFQSLWNDNLADMYLKVRGLLITRRHQVLSPYGINPFSYVEGTISNNRLSFSNMNKSVDIGMGIWIPKLRATVQLGLMEITPTVIKPSNKFLINVTLA